MTAIMHPGQEPRSASAAAIEMADGYSSPYDQISAARRAPGVRAGVTMANLGRGALVRFDNFTDRIEKTIARTRSTTKETLETARVVAFGILEIVAGSPVPEAVPLDAEEGSGMYAGLEVGDSRRHATAEWLGQVRGAQGLREITTEVLDEILERNGNQLEPAITWDEANQVR